MSDVLQIISCGCSPTREVGRLVGLAQAAGWKPYVTLTPSATKWAPVAELEKLTGYPVRSDYRDADEGKSVPECDGIILCPATVNTLNKWATGICDTLALGALVEAVGRGTPIVAVPYGNPALLAFPALATNLENLAGWGVTLLILPRTEMHSAAWRGVDGTTPWARVLQALPDRERR